MDLSSVFLYFSVANARGWCVFRCCFSAFYCFMDLRLRGVVDKLVVDKWRVKRWCDWGCGYLR